MAQDNSKEIKDNPYRVRAGVPCEQETREERRRCLPGGEPPILERRARVVQPKYGRAAIWIA